MKREITTIIFDMDGTLVDTYAVCDCQEKAYYELYPNRHMPREEFLRSYSMTWQDSYRNLGIDTEDWARYHELVEKHITALARPLATVIDGVPQLAAKLRAQGYRLGLNTSRDRRMLRQETERYHDELFHLFDPALSVASDMVENPKPAPDSLLYLCRTAGLAPGQILYVGDSNADMLCARAAGTHFCWAGWCRVDPDAEADDGYAVLQHPQQLMDWLEDMPD